MTDAKNEGACGASHSDAWLDTEIWHMLRGRYGKDLQSVFLLVTTQDKDNVLRQDSWLVYPPGGAAVPNMK